jgi:hypothetical protein
MTYHDHETAGRTLTPAQVNAQLIELARDPRFAAVVAWLDRNHVSWSGTVSKQPLAGQHGQLAHAAGSLHALQVLQGQLMGLLAKPARKRAQEAPDE